MSVVVAAINMISTKAYVQNIRAKCNFRQPLNEGPRFRGWKVDTRLEIWMGISPQPGSLHGMLFLIFDFDYFYEMDLVMEVGRSD